MAKKKPAHQHCTLQVVWMKSRDRFEVHSDDGLLHGFARDQHTAVGIARPDATQAERDGRNATICVEQKDGSFKAEPGSRDEMRSTGTPAVPSIKSEAAATWLLASNFLFLLNKPGAGERIRTVDPNLGKVMLYP
jgi:hypothetical protein